MLLDEISGAIQNWRQMFARLTQREQFMLLGAVATVMTLLVLLLGFALLAVISRQEHRVSVKSQQLLQVLTLQGEYKTRQHERSERLRTLSLSPVRLVSLVEDAAKQSGVEIGQLRPEDSEASEDGIIESRVDLRAAGLSADKLQNFLNKLEHVPGVVVVRRLKLNRPYRKDIADLEMSVSTFKLKSS